MKKLLVTTVSALLCILTPAQGFSHSGRTNAEGCHNNRKTGDYHCHGSKPRHHEVERDERPAEEMELQIEDHKKEDITDCNKLEGDYEIADCVSKHL